jgi:hypothetical protein
VTLTADEIYEEGFNALRERLGIEGMIRFLQQLCPGAGDYARERHKWVDETSIDDILKAAKARRKRTQATKKRP